MGSTFKSDDGIITDAAAEKRLAMEGMDFTLHPYGYRMRFYGEDERTARECAAGLDKGIPGRSMG